MFGFLEKLRQESENKRRRTAFFFSLAVTACILSIWLTIIYPTWIDGQNQEHKAASSLPSPTSAMGSTLLTGFSAIGDQIGAIKDTISSVISTSTYATKTSGVKFSEASSSPASSFGSQN